MLNDTLPPFQKEMQDLKDEIISALRDDPDGFDFYDYMSDWTGIGVYHSAFINVFLDASELWGADTEHGETIMDAIERVVNEAVREEVEQWWSANEDDEREDARNHAFNESLKKLSPTKRIMAIVQHEIRQYNEDYVVDDYNNLLREFNEQISAALPEDDGVANILNGELAGVRYVVKPEPRDGANTMLHPKSLTTNVYIPPMIGGYFITDINRLILKNHIERQLVAWLNTDDDFEDMFIEALDEALDEMLQANPDDPQDNVVVCRNKYVFSSDPKSWTLNYDDVLKFAQQHVGLAFTFQDLRNGLQSIHSCKAWGLLPMDFPTPPTHIIISE